MTTLDTQSELRDLCARRDIETALCHYMRGLDRLMPEVQRSAFHDDAHIDIGTFTGDADAFVKYCQDFLGAMTMSHHQLGQALIQVQGTVATGEVYFTAFHRLVMDGRETDLVIAGRYIDEYQDRGAGWRIAKRCLLVDWARSSDAADGFVKAQADALRLGARGAKDFSNQRHWSR